MKVLYLDCWGNDGEIYRRERNKIEYVDSKSIFNDDLKFLKILKLLGLKINIFFLYFAYGKWKYELEKYDFFIIDSRKTAEYAIKFIREKYPQKRIVVWYWNKMSNQELNPSNIRKKYNVETWTFDLEDSQKYKMKYANSYYFDFSHNKKSSSYKKDVFYIGLNKINRINLIENLKEMFDNYNISYDIRLVKNYKIKEKYNYSKNLNYNEVIDNINSCKVILDLNIKDQKGITLRPMEGLIFEKKIITNNVYIKEFDFYNPKNIFILDENDYDKLKEFIDEPYCKINEKIREKYYFENWLKRLIKRQEYK